MEMPGLGMQMYIRVWLQPPLETEVHWLCTKSSVGGKLFPMRPAWESLCNCLLYVGPEKSQIGFWQGAGLLTPYP